MYNTHMLATGSLLLNRFIGDNRMPTVPLGVRPIDYLVGS